MHSGKVEQRRDEGSLGAENALVKQREALLAAATPAEFIETLRSAASF